MIANSKYDVAKHAVDTTFSDRIRFWPTVGLFSKLLLFAGMFLLGLWEFRRSSEDAGDSVASN
jgi:hypothetical protein